MSKMALLAILGHFVTIFGNFWRFKGAQEVIRWSKVVPWGVIDLLWSQGIQNDRIHRVTTYLPKFSSIPPILMHGAPLPEEDSQERPTPVQPHPNQLSPSGLQKAPKPQEDPLLSRPI